MKYMIKPHQMAVNLTPKILSDQGKTQRAIKSAFTRAKLDWTTAVPSTKNCAWCGKPNSTVILQVHIKGSNVLLSNGGYVKDLHCCFTNGCAYKKLNPNSVDFVAKSRKVSKEEAIKIIHCRNASPFYSGNHVNSDSYRSYQGSRCFNNDAERNALIIKRQNHARSLAGFIERFGLDGKEKWLFLQKQKGITLENLTKKHGENAQKKLDAWKNSISCSQENFVRRHGEVIGKELYKKVAQSHGFYSPVTFTCGGSALRSNLERSFYEILIEGGLLEDVDFVVDGAYPNSSQRFDFWFQQIGIYIEICGCTTKQYRDKMQKKKDAHGAVLVFPKKVLSTAKEMVELCLLKLKPQTL